jgi:hypothetical protein
MSGLIDKIVDKVVDQIMDKLAGGGCEGGSIQDMIRQAVEDVVREQIGGAEDGGSCPANGADSSGGTSPSSDGAEEADSESGCSIMDMKDEGDDEVKHSGNWLVALAQAMAKITGNHLTKMMEAQSDMEKSSDDKSADGKKVSDEEQQANGRKFNEAQGRFQAESKMFSMTTEATSTALKAIGDGLASLARKQ